jgi:hypothetical protein
MMPGIWIDFQCSQLHDSVSAEVTICGLQVEYHQRSRQLQCRQCLQWYCPHASSRLAESGTIYTRHMKVEIMSMRQTASSELLQLNLHMQQVQLLLPARTFKGLFRADSIS